MDSGQRMKYEPNAVLHPGETVSEYLEFFEWSQRELARRTGLTPKTISEICNGKAPISPPTALAFERVFLRPAHFWLGLQRHFDEATARSKDSEALASWSDWVRKFPLRDMERLGFSLPSGRSDAEVLLGFFRVSSPHSWDAVWKASNVVYRQTRQYSKNDEPIAAWVQQVELDAREIETEEYKEHHLRESLKDIRRLTRVGADQIVEPLQQICAAAGVAVVWVPELPHTGISGCARWLSDKKAIVGLTLRYKTEDQMWLTFFHEIAHLLLHRNKRPFVIDNADEDLSDRVVDPEMQQYETEASQFSADTLIPPEALTEFIRGRTFTNDKIHDFAEHVGTSPGIVVGRLQHDQILQPHQGNKLKQRLNLRLVEGG